ncbi:hypothetical protein [Methanobrevibacter sp.]
MRKKVTTISIDENLLRQAKREIPNISVFVESCFIAYLGLDDNIIDVKTELDKIKEAKLKINILTQSNTEETLINAYNKDKINNVWMECWGEYRNTEIINDEQLKKASKILGTTNQELKEMMVDLKLYATGDEIIKCQDFDFAYTKFKQIND